MQQYHNQYPQRQYSTLARSGKAIIQSKVQPFYIANQYPSNPRSPKSNVPTYPRIVHPPFNPTAIMQKLTLKRLRKMQALVRGFLTRRITYPRLLTRYKICQKVFQSISTNCMLQEASSIVLELVSQNKYTKQLTYQSKNDKIMYSLTNKVMDEMVQEMTKEVIATCISDNIVKKKPEIKVAVAKEDKLMYRMNLPEERLAKQVINDYIDKIREDMAKQVIREVVNELRIEKIAEQYILKQKILPMLVRQTYQEYVNQIILEELSNQVIEDTLFEFSRILVKYQVKKYGTKMQEMGVRESQTALFDLIIGEQILDMIDKQQLFDE